MSILIGAVNRKVYMDISFGNINKDFTYTITSKNELDYIISALTDMRDHCYPKPKHNKKRTKK